MVFSYDKDVILLRRELHLLFYFKKKTNELKTLFCTGRTYVDVNASACT